MIRYNQEAAGLTFAVRVVPRACRNEIGGEHGGALRIRITAPPADGAANRELIRLLAKKFKVPQNAVEIVSGTGSKNKTIRVQGVSADALRQLAS